jgi:hypothetical protein
MRWQNWHSNSPDWLDVGGSPQRQVLDSATQPNRSAVEMMRRRLGDGSTCRTSIVDMPIIVPPYCTSRSLYSSFSARISLDPFVLRVKSFSAIHSSYIHLNQHSTVSWLGLFYIERTYISRRVRAMLSFARLPDSGVHSLDHLPQPTAASTS